jgi:hypothetical protein
MRYSFLLALVVLMLSPAPTASPAGLAYAVQPLLKAGSAAGAVTIASKSGFAVQALNDQGQLMFVADNARGGQTLVQLGVHGFTPIVVAGGDAPGGKWGQKAGIRSPVGMNQRGDAVFAADLVIGNQSAVGTFRWDAAMGRLSPVVLKGMPAVHDLTFDTDTDVAPAINNVGDIALAAAVKHTAGREAAQGGVFFLGRDGQLLPVALPEQALPEGDTVAWAWLPSLNDAGALAFQARPEGDLVVHAYVWAHGTVTPVPMAGLVPPRGRHLAGFTGVWVNDRNKNVLLAAHLHSLAGISYALYMLTGSKLVPVAMPDQEMPGGGRFDTLQPNGVSAASESGEHAFLAQLEDGSTAAYRMDAGGKLSLILKSGSVTPVGRVTNVGQGAGRSSGVGLNSRGQVCLTLRFAGAPDTLALLTPTAGG